MTFCERCRSDEATCQPHGVALCHACASEMRMFDADHGLVGQDVQQADFFDEVPGPVMFGRKIGKAASASDAGQAPGAIAKTADAAGQIAKTVKVVAVVVGVAGVAWVGYSLWKARQAAVGLQAGAQHAFLAHPELLRI